MTNIEERTIRVLLVDDHQTMLWGLEQLINGRAPRMRVVGTALTLEDALVKLQDLKPDVVLLDMDLGSRSGLEAVPEFLASSDAKILFLTGMRDQDKLDTAVVVGARGVVRKEEPASLLLSAIEKVYSGQIWMDRDAVGRVFQRMHEKDTAADRESARIASLTRREREIVAALVESADAPNKVLAQKLFMGEHTLRNHLTVIYEKLGVDSRIQLYLYAMEHGLGKPGDSKPKPRSRDF